MDKHLDWLFEGIGKRFFVALTIFCVSILVALYLLVPVYTRLIPHQNPATVTSIEKREQIIKARKYTDIYEMGKTPKFPATDLDDFDAVNKSTIIKY